MKNHIETANGIIQHDDSDQAELEKLHVKRAQLETEFAAADDDTKPPADVIAMQDRIQLEIDKLDRQQAIFEKRAKARVAGLFDSLKGMKKQQQENEHKFRHERVQLANDTISKQDEQIQGFKDLLLAIVWLRDSSDSNYLEALENMLDGKGHFDRHETAHAAKKLGLYLDEPEQPTELDRAEDIIGRELGDHWQHQNADWMGQKLQAISQEQQQADNDEQYNTVNLAVIERTQPHH